GLRVGDGELGRVLAAEELHVVRAPEADVRSRLDDQRKAKLGARRLRFLCRARVEGARDGEADRLGGVELVALRLDVLEHVPARKREAVTLLELAGVTGERVEVLVVRG